MEITLLIATAAIVAAAVLPTGMGARPSPIATGLGAFSGALIVVLLSPTAPAAAIAAAAIGIGMAIAVVTDLGEGYLYFAPIAAAIGAGLLARLLGGITDDPTGTSLSLMVAVGAIGLYGTGRLFGRWRPLPTDPDSGEPMEAYGLFDTLLWLMVAAALPGVVALGAFVLSALANGVGALLLFAWRASGRSTPVGLPQAPFIAGAIVAVLLWIAL